MNTIKGTTKNDEPVIVCATDFSSGSAGALAWATELAARQGGWLDLVHVVPDLPSLVEATAADQSTLQVPRVERAREELAALARGPVSRGITVRTDVLVGDAPAALEEHARGRGARMLVLGASARPTLERWMLGSVAERTVRRAERPVVVVPPTVGAGSWPAERAPRAVVALEGNEAPDLLGVIAELRRGGPCDVTVLHLYWPPEEFARLGLRGPRDPAVPDPDVIRDLEPRLRTLIGALPGRGEVRFLIHPAWGETASSIALSLEEEPCDLVVVGSHHRHGLARVLRPPVAEHLLRLALRVPVMCVPTARPSAAVDGLPPAGRISSVLAPTDLSSLGNASVAHAYALLRAGGGVVELLHVREGGLPSPAYAYGVPARITDAERADLEGQLRALIPADAGASGIATHLTVVDGGRAAEAIVQAAERLHVDIISLGSHGRGGVGRALLGSVSDEVVRRARRPVLVVR